MKIFIGKDKEEASREAALRGASVIREAIREKGGANIILATGASQLELLEHLVRARVDWRKVTAFHLDEYIGIPVTHPASFRKYLTERVSEKVPVKDFHFINGENDPGEECMRLGSVLDGHPVDVAFIGIGENGHLAFNDPPADFETEDPYIVVRLDRQCREQQFGEGWFASVEEVPETAISMSVSQIMKSRAIICTVPDTRKAKAVKCAMEGDVSPKCPASVLRKHNRVYLFLDQGSSSLLRRI
jgi:glucosamine-6-phosphate deaminase